MVNFKLSKKKGICVIILSICAPIVYLMFGFIFCYHQSLLCNIVYVLLAPGLFIATSKIFAPDFFTGILEIFFYLFILLLQVIYFYVIYSLIQKREK